MTLMIPTKS